MPWYGINLDNCNFSVSKIKNAETALQQGGLRNQSELNNVDCFSVAGSQ